jgi:hypothetical protein
VGLSRDLGESSPSAACPAEDPAPSELIHETAPGLLPMRALARTEAKSGARGWHRGIVPPQRLCVDGAAGRGDGGDHELIGSSHASGLMVRCA